jgi:hypothetical protein
MARTKITQATNHAERCVFFIKVEDLIPIPISLDPPLTTAVLRFSGGFLI